jgi:8-oxo-dGTP pyrophosphatase MutT (NUDIX family)
VLHDGNGWVHCRCGRRHWGLHGAAGLLVVRCVAQGDARPVVQVLLQLRAGWTHQGGTWGLPGGARDSHEDVVVAALREAHEEVGLDEGAVQVVGSSVGTDHGDWSYTYVIARARPTVAVHVRNDESDEIRWVGVDDVGALPLHPALAPAWAGLRARVAELHAA